MHPLTAKRYETARREGAAADNLVICGEYSMTCHTRNGLVTLAGMRVSDPVRSMRRARKLFDGVGR